MRGAHDNGSHGSKCLMGLRPGKRRDCGNGAESRGLAAADSREAEPQRERSYELARDDQRAGNNHERREHIQKSPSAFSSRFWNPIATDIRAIRWPAAKASRSRGFPWRLSSAVIQMFRYSVFLRLLTRAMEQHVDTHRFIMQVTAGSSRMNG